MTDDTLIPNVPNESLSLIVGGAARNILTVLAGLGFAWASAVTGSQVQMGVSAAIEVATLLWMAWAHIQQARNSRKTSVASAALSAEATQLAGAPVARVVVAPSIADTPAVVAALNRAEASLH